MKRLASVALLILAGQLRAQSPFEYSISFGNKDHHEAEVEITFTDLPDTVLEVRMSRSSPGRYALHEFAKNVYDVKAEDSQGNSLQFTRPNLHQWNFSHHDGTVSIRYTIFGDRSDGTYLGIDNTHAHLNMPATFMWARGHADRPIEIRFHRPEPHWEVATQLATTDLPDVYRAPDLAYFLDSPTELSPFHWREWQVGPDEMRQSVALALHHEGTDAETDAYAALCRAVVREARMIFGEYPRFDFGKYTFIADYLPHVNGDGMEHRNSTICTSSKPLADGYLRKIGTISHEFFHCWNAERIRPRSLEPFDFERANMSGELWFAEGVTSYYDGLILKRAGIYSIDRYAEKLTRILQPFLNLPGRRFFSPVEMSMQAPFVDAGISIDRKNLRNTYISYYIYGSAVALGLDLTLRRDFADLILDDFMSLIWERYGKPEQPYSNDDLEKTLAEVSKDQMFARRFFADYVYGKELPDYAGLLAQAGFMLRSARPDEAWLGPLAFKFEDGKMKVGRPTLIGSPLYNAGIDRDDVIKTIADTAFADLDELKAFIKRRRIGDTVVVEFEKNGIKRSEELTFFENPEFEVVPFEHENRLVSVSAAAFRERWLGSLSGLDGDEIQRHCPVCRRAFPFRFDFCKYDGEALGLTPAELSPEQNKEN